MTESPDILTLFKSWLNDLLGHRDSEIIESLNEIEETHEMFATALKKHDDELKRISRLQGIHETRIETAKALLNEKMNIEKISEITGLSVDEIEKLN